VLSPDSRYGTYILTSIDELEMIADMWHKDRCHEKASVCH